MVLPDSSTDYRRASMSSPSRRLRSGTVFGKSEDEDCGNIEAIVATVISRLTSAGIAGGGADQKAPVLESPQVASLGPAVGDGECGGCGGADVDQRARRRAAPAVAAGTA